MSDSKVNESVKFGGFAFTHAMEMCFVEQLECLECFLNAHVQALPHPAGLVLANAHRSGKAICDLLPHESVNEAFLLMRVLVEELVDAIYLLHCSDEAKSLFLNRRELFPHLKPDQLTGECIQTAEASKLDGLPERVLGSLRQRIEVICEKAGTNKKQWCLAIGSIFPTSCEFLAGTSTGYMSAFPGAKFASKNSEQITMLSLFGVGLLDETISIFSKAVSEKEISLRARQILKRASVLMSQSSDGLQDLAAGSWSRLGRVESISSRNRLSELSRFQKAFELSYEAGVIVTTLKGKNDRHFKMSALYLRRALNDFRSVWLLVSSGYTSQAALSAGSLFESCRAASCLLYPEYIAEFESKLEANGKAAEIPWQPKQMTEMVARKEMSSTDTETDYQNSWRALYASRLLKK